ncbi:olfactory receptor 1019-like isoform X2 [Eublepharis macularius]|uniref:Olfactory receptor 1019-like isoform X2 n=1 Tax=Eublepharis macularius TaxID=481883 RepID=A0AA97KNB5_EUBMA|nr:olfactory receptor 1019-like isoform X2 [Eublepharis macularius]
MAEKNNTKITELVLLGLVDNPETMPVGFVVVLIMYLFTLVGNLGMIMLIWMDPKLQKPMYFFLSHLSFLDFGYASAVAPKMLENFIAEQKTISFTGCAAQMYFFAFCTCTECILLAAMAYDRYDAICNPLMYMTNMSRKKCILMVAGSYFFIGFLSAMAQTISTFTLPFCSSNIINHFFCDVPPLLVLSCTDTSHNQMILFVFAIVLNVFTSIEILVSYMMILSAILRIRSTKGKQKAFSTCASHLMAVTIFYGTTGFMYLRPSSSYSLDQDK